MAAHGLLCVQIYQAIHKTLSPAQPSAMHVGTLLDAVTPPPLPAAVSAADPGAHEKVGWESFAELDRSVACRHAFRVSTRRPG